MNAYARTHPADAALHRAAPTAIPPAPTVAPPYHGSLAVQRKAETCACGGGCPRCQATTAARVDDVLRSPGEALPQDARGYFETRFGADFSQVRIHTDAKAAASARALNASAYTVGRDVVFGAGQYQLGSADGQKLLAHELTHVVQSGGTAADTLSEPGSAAEREADGVAGDYAAGRELRQVRTAATGLHGNWLGSSSEVSQSVSETITNAPAYPAWNNKTFTWTSRFGLFYNAVFGTVTIIVRLYSAANATVRSAWESAIESKWSNRFMLSVRDPRGGIYCYPLLVDVQWVNDARRAHYTITPSTSGATAGGRAGLGGTTSMTDWGTADTVDITHEFGHMLGNTEEYFTTNGVDYTYGGTRTGFRDPGGGVMNNPSENPEPRHYELPRRNAATLLGVPDANCRVVALCIPIQAPTLSPDAGDYPLPTGEERYA